MSYIKLSGEPVGDGGDQYTGLDRFGRVVDNRWMNSSNVDIDRILYTYSRASNRLTIDNSVTGFDQSCSYDDLYQLTERTGTAPTEQFNYDPTGNWNSYINGANTQNRTHQKANEITAITGTPSATMAYDANGNTTTLPQAGNWSNTQTAAWDAWNRLVKVKQGSTTLGTYQYDGLNRRIWKQSLESGTLTTRHFYYSDKWQVLEERINTSTSANVQYVWGTRYTDDLVLRDRFGGISDRYYALADYFQTTAIANTSGAVVETYTFSAFGTPLSSSSYGWEYLFGSYYYDIETGLYQVRFRYYHSALGRWLSRDPIGEAAGTNLYAYVLNNAVNNVDPAGLCVCCLFEAYFFCVTASDLLNTVTAAANSFGAVGMGGSEPPSGGEIAEEEAAKNLLDVALEGVAAALTAAEQVLYWPADAYGGTIKGEVKRANSARDAYYACIQKKQSESGCSFSEAAAVAQSAQAIYQQAEDIYNSQPGSLQRQRALQGN